MITVNVVNMTSTNGNKVSNQFMIQTNEGLYFKSYDSIIAFIPRYGKIQLDINKWDYSNTTGKYRNMFLQEGIKETKNKIKTGEYELVDLN